MTIFWICVIIICTIGLIGLVIEIIRAPLEGSDGKMIYGKKKQAKEMKRTQKEFDTKMGIKRYYSNDMEDLKLIWEMSMHDYDVNEIMTVKDHPDTKQPMYYFSMIKKTKS